MQAGDVAEPTLDDRVLIDVHAAGVNSA